jgi:hypothetical protein
MKVTLSEEDARNLTHPKLAPHGVESAAEYRTMNYGEVYLSDSSGFNGLLVRYDNRAASNRRLVVTPRKPSFAQLVKDSGWRCPLAHGTRLLADSQRQWFVECGRYSHTALLRPEAEPQIDLQSCEDRSVALGDDGYPIVEEGDA